MASPLGQSFRIPNIIVRRQLPVVLFPDDVEIGRFFNTLLNLCLIGCFKPYYIRLPPTQHLPLNPPAGLSEAIRSTTMASTGTLRSSPDEKTIRRTGKSPVRSEPRQVVPKGAMKKPTDYTSEGVTDNDVFLLPGSDFQIVGLLTGIAAIVRLFRIYQPTSVVFDEVQ